MGNSYTLWSATVVIRLEGHLMSDASMSLRVCSIAPPVSVTVLGLYPSPSGGWPHIGRLSSAGGRGWMFE